MLEKFLTCLKLVPYYKKNSRKPGSHGFRDLYPPPSLVPSFTGPLYTQEYYVVTPVNDAAPLRSRTLPLWRALIKMHRLQGLQRSMWGHNADDHTAKGVSTH